MFLSGQPIRVLVIDDDEDDFLIIQDYIRSIENATFTLDWCYTYKDAIGRFASKQHDIYFVDYRLGAKTGIDLLKDAVEMQCEEPIILLTGKGNRDIDREAMRVGAVDYLVKSELNTEKLERSIRYALDHYTTLKALRESERKYRGIFDGSKDAVFITDRELRFKDCNPATSDLLRYPKERLTQLTLYDLIEGEELKKRIREGLDEDGEVVDLEIVVIDHRHEKKVCVLTASLHNENENVQFIQAIIHDITNLKKAERAALYTEKLATAGRLVRTLAHEVRNPLNNIQMSVEHLDTELIPDEDKVFYEIIKRNIKRIDDLIAELLDSYKPTEKEFKKNGLDEILKKSIEIASDRMTLKGIQIDTDFPEKSLLILADDEKLKIAFLNILINATEAIHDQGGRIKVSLQEKDKHCLVMITDNGCGIPQDILSKLFEPYFTSKRNGMGLGLASTLNIVQAHQGTIEVKSTVNKGTTFTIILPQLVLKSVEAAS
ncbi:MAG TPA: ATP-binding protein [Ohtaekwangia sp.]